MTASTSGHNCDTFWGTGQDAGRQGPLEGPNRHQWTGKSALIPMSTHRDPQKVSTLTRQNPKSTPRDPQKVSVSCTYPLRNSDLSHCHG